MALRNRQNLSVMTMEPPVSPMGPPPSATLMEQLSQMLLTPVESSYPRYPPTPQHTRFPQSRTSYSHIPSTPIARTPQTARLPPFSATFGPPLRASTFPLPPPSTPGPTSAPRPHSQSLGHCNRCSSPLRLPPPPSSFHRPSGVSPFSPLQPLNLDRSRPRCLNCDIASTKQAIQSVITPPPSLIDPVEKITADMAKMDEYRRQGVMAPQMKEAIIGARRRLENTMREREGGVEKCWRRFGGVWGGEVVRRVREGEI